MASRTRRSRPKPVRESNLGAGAGSIADRIAALFWPSLESTLEAQGFAITPQLLSPSECERLVALYNDDRHFRKRIVMGPLRFGEGEYKYFEAPLPGLVGELRDSLYPRLAPVANRWALAMRQNSSFPPALGDFLERCAAAGQIKPTPLLLRYGPGGYNCLHQDLYGEIAFPIQATIVLSRRGIDYDGGDFLLVEQRPRAQSRGHAIDLEQGCAILFANAHRPVASARGFYRVNMRHGVSTICCGQRLSLGIIFHNAK
ncbi:MAG TPA: 2OG-Fe(II) oxygenase [Candidatus Binataceae bacterium]